MLLERFGRLKSREMVEIITIRNECACLKLLTFGARIHSFYAHGVNVIGGYECIEDYEADDSYQGAIAGRVANRIENAEFNMDGAIYMQLPSNSSPIWFIHSAFLCGLIDKVVVK